MGAETEILTRVPSRLQKHVSVVTPKELGQPMLYHVSDNKRLRLFQPKVSNRMLGSEDRMIPRVSTSNTLVGCIAGHDGTDYLFQDEGFDGLFKVYGIEFEAALKPKAALVADGPQTNEHWLITYNQDTETYPAIPLAEFCYTRVSYMRVKATMEAEVLLKVTHPDGLWLTNNRHLEPGHYRLVGVSPRVYKKHSATRKPMTIDSVQPLSASEYKTEKEEKGVVSMESVGARSWMQW